MNRFVIAEPARCNGCNTCMAACSVVHKAAGLQSFPRLTVVRHGDRTAPVLCRQCDDAPCAQVCPVNAITQTGDAVVLNETLCIGCKLCAIVCPFGAITPAGTPSSGVVSMGQSYISPNMLTVTEPGAAGTDSSATLHPILVSSIGVRSIAVKCDLCDFRAEGPECVRVCPTSALFAVDDQTLNQTSDTKRQQAAVALASPLTFIAPQEQK